MPENNIHIMKEEEKARQAKLTKQRANTRLRVAKWRQKHHEKQVDIYHKSQNNIHIIEESKKEEQAKLIKQRADAQLRMVKLRQYRSKAQIDKINLLKTQ